MTIEPIPKAEEHENNCHVDFEYMCRVLWFGPQQTRARMSGDAILAPGIVDGTRQLFVIRVEEKDPER